MYVRLVCSLLHHAISAGTNCGNSKDEHATRCACNKAVPLDDEATYQWSNDLTERKKRC